MCISGFVAYPSLLVAVKLTKTWHWETVWAYGICGNWQDFCFFFNLYRQMAHPDPIFVA